MDVEIGPGFILQVYLGFLDLLVGGGFVVDFCVAVGPDTDWAAGAHQHEVVGGGGLGTLLQLPSLQSTIQYSSVQIQFRFSSELQH